MLQPIMLDANVLTLFIVGQVSEDMVERCRRTRQYKIQDYHLLVSYVAPFTNLLVTPNIATEVSNLLGVLSGDHLIRARKILYNYIGTWTEVYVESNRAKVVPEYTRLGLTDAAILLIASHEMEVLTDDFDLYSALLKRGIKATNFTHIRTRGMI